MTSECRDKTTLGQIAGFGASGSPESGGVAHRGMAPAVVPRRLLARGPSAAAIPGRGFPEPRRWRRPVGAGLPIRWARWSGWTLPAGPGGWGRTDAGADR